METSIRVMIRDGYHAGAISEDVSAFVESLRAQRPDTDFTVSMRLDWDLGAQNVDEIVEVARTLEQAGVDALHVAPDRGDLEPWLETQGLLAHALELRER